MDDDKQYLTVTPLGALYATSKAEASLVKNMLIKLLRMGESPILSDKLIMQLADRQNVDAVKDTLYELQMKHYIQAEKKLILVPSFNIQSELPAVLRLLSSSGKVLLTDLNGFVISYSGFAEKNVEELSIISSQFTNIYLRYGDFISEKFEDKYTSVGIINNQGISRIGFIILDIAGALFTLTIGDTPFLNQRTFRDIIWLLTYRYSGTVQE